MFSSIGSLHPAQACRQCPARQALFLAWERRLKAEGLGIVPLSERHWNAVTQQTCKVLSIETNLARSDDPDKDPLLPAVNPFEGAESELDGLVAAIPPRIVRILQMDHRRWTRREKERLAAWLEGESRRLVRQFGFM
jgi:hypothetical protein